MENPVYHRDMYFKMLFHLVNLFFIYSLFIDEDMFVLMEVSIIAMISLIEVYDILGVELIDPPLPVNLFQCCTLI